MPVRCRRGPAFLLLASLWLAGVPAQADDGRGRGGGGAERAERGAVPPPSRRERQQDALSDSVRRIERSTRSQVLSAERVPYDGRDINRIKVVDDRGRVRVYMDDPQQPERGARPTRGDDD